MENCDFKDTVMYDCGLREHVMHECDNEPIPSVDPRPIAVLLVQKTLYENVNDEILAFVDDVRKELSNFNVKYRIVSHAKYSPRDLRALELSDAFRAIADASIVVFSDRFDGPGIQYIRDYCCVNNYPILQWRKGYYDENTRASRPICGC